MLKNREDIFNVIVEYALKYGILDEFQTKYKDFNTWEKYNFNNEESINNLFIKLIRDLEILDENTTIDDFFKYCACDLFPTSQYCWGGISCIRRSKNYKYLIQNDNSILIASLNRDNNDDRFLYLDGIYKGNGKYKSGGKWDCDENDKIKFIPITTQTSTTTTNTNTSDKAIYRRPGDPYEYFLDKNQWYAKRINGTKDWVNISNDEKYKSSVDILNQELSDGKLIKYEKPSTNPDKVDYSTSGTIKDGSNAYKSVSGSDGVVYENKLKKIIRDSLLKHVKD